MLKVYNAGASKTASQARGFGQFSFKFHVIYFEKCEILKVKQVENISNLLNKNFVQTLTI